MDSCVTPTLASHGLERITPRAMECPVLADQSRQRTCPQREERSPLQSRTNSVTSGSSPNWRLRWPCSAGSNTAPAGKVSAE